MSGYFRGDRLARVGPSAGPIGDPIFCAETTGLRLQTERQCRHVDAGLLASSRIPPRWRYRHCGASVVTARVPSQPKGSRRCRTATHPAKQRSHRPSARRSLQSLKRLPLARPVARPSRRLSSLDRVQGIDAFDRRDRETHGFLPDLSPNECLRRMGRARGWSRRAEQSGPVATIGDLRRAARRSAIIGRMLVERSRTEQLPALLAAAGGGTWSADNRPRRALIPADALGGA
jgi:hypothetical protein